MSYMGDMFRRRRTELGLGLRQASRALGLSAAALGKLESGDTTALHEKYWPAACRLYGFSFEELEHAKIMSQVGNTWQNKPNRARMEAIFARVLEQTSNPDETLLLELEKLLLIDKENA